MKLLKMFEISGLYGLKKKAQQNGQLRRLSKEIKSKKVKKKAIRDIERPKQQR